MLLDHLHDSRCSQRLCELHDLADPGTLKALDVLRMRDRLGRRSVGFKRFHEPVVQSFKRALTGEKGDDGPAVETVRGGVERGMRSEN